MKTKLTAVSKDRYRANAQERRKYGGKTVTEFHVHNPTTNELWTVTGYGPTPADRKRFAVEAVQRILADREGGQRAL